MTKRRRSYKELGDAVILYTDNYINNIEGEKLEELCVSFLNKGITKIVIDFSGTELVNSIGVSILIGIIEKINEKKGIVYFSGLKRINYDIFRLVGLTNHIQVFNTEDDAVSEINKFRGHMIM